MTTLRKAGAIFLLLSATASPAWAAHWIVDPAKSHIGFNVSWGGEPLKGEFKTWKANIDFDAANLPKSRADVTIDMTDTVTDDDEINGALQGSLGFDVTDYPAARFKTSKITAKGGSNYEAIGTLTLKGINRQVILPFTLTIAGTSAHMIGTAHVMRSDFHVGGGEYEDEKPVSHDVTVSIDLTATKAR